ncbi:unnamed protein product [Rangifer tarandus platyrhynchus]|uniref:Uncharacterized protein n=2 Tax=Rangifer tarandus platyrhynchus TaxID=3082113 RepID=A0ACB0E525_RANTA|nr:unnamed protein product [Rangifer tarandus platyrhynchus]CAI9695577.1 unnamed protein product [Rangifer tarandus platyrhynchus]
MMCSLSTSSTPGLPQPPVRHTEFPLPGALFLHLVTWPPYRPGSSRRVTVLRGLLGLRPLPGSGGQAPKPASGPTRWAPPAERRSVHLVAGGLHGGHHVRRPPPKKAATWRQEPGPLAWQKESALS